MTENEDMKRINAALDDHERGVSAGPRLIDILSVADDTAEDWEPPYPPPAVGTMTWAREQVADLFEQCEEAFSGGQKEYARREANFAANFERVAERTGISREKALLVYLEKHLDGIHAYVNGHRSQRESVEGRIKDAINYLGLLYAMGKQEEGK